MLLSHANQRYGPLAQRIMRRVPEVLRQHRLLPAFKKWALTNDNGLVILFGVLDDDRIVRQTQRPLLAYHAPAVLHDISTIMDGVPVVPSNSSGLRYAFVLDEGNLRTLPPRADFPGVERGQLRFGVGYGGQSVQVAWANTHHILIAGATGSGKSNCLRSLVYQAVMDGFQLGLVDVESRTFDMLAGHPALLAPIAKDLPGAHAVVLAAHAELKRREQLFAACPGYPDNVDEYNTAMTRTGGERLPRLLLVLDEYNALVLATGGVKRQFATDVTKLVLGGRKWGLHLIFAGHEFTREATGLVRGQCNLRLCFRVEDVTTSNIVVNSGAAVGLRGEGQAIVRGLGKVQTYLLDKAVLERLAPVVGPRLTEAERELAAILLDRYQGRLSEAILRELGQSQRAARSWVGGWVERGWAAKDPQRNNACYLTPELIELIPDSATLPALAESVAEMA